jgi:hypothetical protein
MSMVYPRAAQVVQPASNFEIDETGKLTYNAKASNGGKVLIVLLVGLSFIFAIVLAVGVAIAPQATLQERAIALLAVPALLACFFRFLKWGSKLPVRPIVFDNKSITMDGKTYLLDHVSRITWRCSDGYFAAGFGIQGAFIASAAAAAYQTSGVVAMQYGSDVIPILSGLHPDKTQQAYRDIIGFLGRVGRKYG